MFSRMLCDLPPFTSQDAHCLSIEPPPLNNGSLIQAVVRVGLGIEGKVPPKAGRFDGRIK
jgi:hypothetical protein